MMSEFIYTMKVSSHSYVMHTSLGPLRLEVDARADGAAAVLLQEDVDGVDHPAPPPDVSSQSTCCIPIPQYASIGSWSST